MLRDNLGDSFYRCLENRRPNGAVTSLPENVISPLQAEPAHIQESISKTEEKERFPDKCD
jgi:hypothetical protein